jgi:hypothetical protein
MDSPQQFRLIMRETSLAPSHFASSFAKEVASRIAGLPLSDVCERGGNAADASVNVRDVETDNDQVRATIEIIFVERFPLGCSNALTERPRRARFAIALDRATRICEFSPIECAPEPDL